MAKRSFYVKDSELDDYQVKVINKKTDNSYIVKGCAGSGKSILALWKAKQIQDEHKGSYLYIVYTKALKRYMSDGIKEIGLQESNVANYDACFSYSRNDFGELERGAWKKGSYDYIIVDEAQDFSIDDIELLKSKARKAILIYGDTAQQIFKFLKNKKTASMEEIQFYTKLPDEKLVFNHRLPKKIARVAEFLNSENDDLVDRCVDEGTEMPKIIKYDTLEQQLDSIIHLVKNKNMEDVGILFRTRKEMQEAYDYFLSKDFEVHALIKGDLDFTSPLPKLLTYHSSKGLQFEHVFMPECTSEGEDNRNPLYVAVTRTYRALYIMHSGNLSSLFDDVPTSLYDTSLTSGPKLTLGGLSTPKKQG